MKIKLTFLGTGTSQGVPVIGCECEVCQSDDFRDNRLRNAALIEIDDKVFAIDCGPDFRQQMLREKVSKLDAILITHEHTDHIIGLDDIRAFNFRNKKDMPVFASQNTAFALKKRFDYIFRESPYPGIPRVNLNLIKKEQLFEVAGYPVIPIEVMHGKMPVLGFRFGNFAYITDIKTITDEELGKLRNLNVLAISSLQEQQHHSHMNLQETLDLIEKIKPKQTYLTHISHKMGKHSDFEKRLPDGVAFAYDGLKIETE